MPTEGTRLPSQQSYEDTFKFLTWDQFPKILDSSIRYFAALPETGIYKHVNPKVRDFQSALLDTTDRQFTLSGVGSLIDYETYGHQIKRPSPQTLGTGCNANSLCLEPTCFGFTEGVIESNNVLQNMCWSLAMPCLKDHFYSDRRFMEKMKEYFRMFFKQPAVVLEAYQRTRLIKESVKVLATDTNIRFKGTVIGGDAGIPLPFYIDPVDPTNFPNLTTLAASGINLGGFNLAAFSDYVAPRMFSGAFGDGMEGIKTYGLKSDYMNAKEQTASVLDHYYDQQILQSIQMRTGSTQDRLDSLLGDFTHDGLFPTFKNESGTIVPITQEILEASTIAGYVQTDNPEHALAEIRGLLFVPNNWRFDLVAPPKDDFSDLGLGKGLDFRMSTPGVHPIMSSSMFASSGVGKDGTVTLGQYMRPDGSVVYGAKGLQKRAKVLSEAVRTELLLTYAAKECATGIPNVGPAAVPQGRADGFELKSTMYIGSDVRGIARPVLVLFKRDMPRSAKPIEICSPVEVTVSDTTAEAKLVSCCPGDQIFAILTFSEDVSADFSVGHDVIFRQGAQGVSYVAQVTAVSGHVVSIQSTDGTTIIPCCSAGVDDYGIMGELLNETTATATTSEIMKAEWDSANAHLDLEFFDPLAAGLSGAGATITLRDGQVIAVDLDGNAGPGVSASVVADGGETTDISTLDCECLYGAVFTYD